MEVTVYIGLLRKHIETKKHQLDVKNRQALHERDYLINCGRLQMLVDLESILSKKADELQRLEDSDV